MNRALPGLVSAWILCSCSQGPTVGPPDAAPAPAQLRVEAPGRLHAVVGEPLAVTLAAQGGIPPYRWSLASGAVLPAGLALSPVGEVQGTPTAVGAAPVGVTVTDSQEQSASTSLELDVQDSGQPGETCSGATTPQFMGEQAFVEGTLEGFRPDGLAEACGLPAAAERFYRVEVEEASLVTIDVKSAGFNAALYQEGCARRPVVCETRIVERLEKGSYVFGVTGPASRFELTVRVTRVFEQGPGDTCDDAIPLDLSGGEARMSGTFGGARQDLEGCGAGPDRIYAFTLSQAADVEVSGSAAFSIRSGATCATSTQLACIGGRLRMPNLPAGRYFLVLSSEPYSTHPYAAVVSVLPPTQPPTNSTCATATPVAFVGDSATLEGDLLGLGPIAKACPPMGPAVFYAIDLDRKAHLEVSTSSAVSLRLLDDTCFAPLAQECTSKGGDLCAANLRPGRYVLQVQWSKEGATPGPFQVQVERRDPAAVPPNATCAAATRLALESGRAIVTGQLTNGTQDLVLPCAASGGFAVFYQLRLERRSTLKVGVSSPENDSFAVAVSKSCEAGSYVGCGAWSAPASLSLSALEPGDYWIAVKGSSLRCANECRVGQFTLGVEATPE